MVRFWLEQSEKQQKAQTLVVPPFQAPASYSQNELPHPLRSLWISTGNLTPPPCCRHNSEGKILYENWLGTMSIMLSQMPSPDVPAILLRYRCNSTFLKLFPEQPGQEGTTLDICRGHQWHFSPTRISSFCLFVFYHFWGFFVFFPFI
jgi:hypothetical protein